MDRDGLIAANLLAGNPAGAAGLEWALGSGVVRFETAMPFALGGARVAATVNGRPAPMHVALRADPGEELRIEPTGTGRFSYLAVGGGVDVPVTLGSRSTYLRGRFGGLHGRLVRTGDFLPVGPLTRTAPPAGFGAPAALLPEYARPLLRVIPGPQATRFSSGVRARLAAVEWTVGALSDRMGYRLEGEPLFPDVAATGASDPTCPGAIQIPDGGLPIVLMADGPTVGGYPKIAVVCGEDLSLLAQRPPGSQVRLAWIDVAEAQRLHRRRRIRHHTLATLVRAAAAS